MRNKSNKGFTLIELLIVIAIIGILAAVLIPNLLRARQVAVDRAAESYVKNVYTAGQAYMAEDINATIVGNTDCGGTTDTLFGEYTVSGPGAWVVGCEYADGAAGVRIHFDNGTDGDLGVAEIGDVSAITLPAAR